MAVRRQNLRTPFFSKGVVKTVGVHFTALYFLWKQNQISFWDEKEKEIFCCDCVSEKQGNSLKRSQVLNSVFHSPKADAATNPLNCHKTAISMALRNKYKEYSEPNSLYHTHTYTK